MSDGLIAGGLVELLSILVWSWVVWKVASYALARRKAAAQTPAPGAARDQELQRAQSERSRQMMLRAFAWTSAYALSPQRVVNLVIMNTEALSMAQATKDVREACVLCYSEGRCRGPEFTRFVAGAPLAVGDRLVFVAVAESDLQQHWYGLVVPSRHLVAAVSARAGKVVE